MSIIDELIRNRNATAYYNATDLNRVGEAVAWLAQQLLNLGYQCIVTPKVDWTIYDVPLASQMNHYLEDLRTIRDTLTLPQSTPMLPNTMDGLTITKANNIETLLFITNLLMEWMVSIFFYVGDLYSGEV